MDSPSTAPNPPAKTPVHRGARACMVCRQAKMKCVGAEDGTQRCQRCQRAGVDCVFEKHRRGRKPGSKLSEASKMLRRLEKGLNNAKAKQPSSPLAQAPPPSSQFGQEEGAGPSNFQASSSHSAQQFDDDMDDEEEDRPDEALYPEKVIRSSNKSFFDVVMNRESDAANTPEQARPRSGASSERSHSIPKAASQSPMRSHSSPQPRPYSSLFDHVPKDPVSAGIIHESEVGPFFDLFFIRLNPFINLFDPSLHSHKYVRDRSPFLFTAMLMACCKFFRTNIYPAVRRLAEEWSIFSFAEGTENVETVQALACMTYWKEPADRRTWSYIGMACRMAVKLGLNKYVGRRQLTESPLHFLERRNRERTYLVLFVHDRSLSMQTGKHWMLHEDEFVRNAATWHEDGCIGARGDIRPEDVVVAAFVQLRLIGSEATDTFYAQANTPTPSFPVNVTFANELHKYNTKLDVWSEYWDQQIRQCTEASEFHSAFIQFFQSHVRLFLNTFGLHLTSVDTRLLPDPEAVQQCQHSAHKNLQIITEFDKLHVLPYCQESITVMTAYAAIVLLKLLRRPGAPAPPPESAVEQTHAFIIKAAEAYQHAGHITGSDPDSAVYHARFLRRLVAIDIERSRQHLDRNAFRQDGMPPLFGTGLTPFRNAQSSEHQPQQDTYSLPRPGHAHGHSAAPLPPLSMMSHHPGFSNLSNGTVMHNSRVPTAYPPAQPSSEADESYFNYMITEVSEAGHTLFPRGEVSPTSGYSANPVLMDFGYPSSNQYREPPYPHVFGTHLAHSRPAPSHQYLPPVQSFGHAVYDNSR
ncbi:fungal-specific transcription factor domain-containing protein [Trametes polyzona]|nr:fungal-specific transcription factor domain-containing protein [Trametes polyzona]